MSIIASESILSRWAALEELSTALARGHPCLQADGLWGSSRSLVVGALVKHTGRSVLLMAPGPAERHRLAEDVRFFLASLGAGDRLPVLEFPPAEPASWRGRHKEQAAERARACHHLGGEGAVVVATPSALAAPLLSPTAFRARAFSLEVAGTIDRETLVHWLDLAGYERVDTVAGAGGVLRRRRRVTAALRPDHPALHRGPRRDHRAAPVRG